MTMPMSSFKPSMRCIVSTFRAFMWENSWEYQKSHQNHKQETIKKERKKEIKFYWLVR